MVLQTVTFGGIGQERDYLQKISYYNEINTHFPDWHRCCNHIAGSQNHRLFERESGNRSVNHGIEEKKRKSNVGNHLR